MQGAQASQGGGNGGQMMQQIIPPGILGGAVRRPGFDMAQVFILPMQ